MSTVRAGQMPAAMQAYYSPFSEKTKSGRNKLRITNGGLEWDLSTGWHPKRARGWIGKARKAGILSKTTVVGVHGEQITVYDTGDNFSDYIGFHATGTDSVRDNVLAAMEVAFNDDPNISGYVAAAEAKEGHIAKVEWSQGAKGSKMGPMLRVTFRDGTICIFGNVPSSVAGVLLSLARSGATRGTGKHNHLLGIQFWDLVRIRGQRHGARYPFEYVKKAAYKVIGRPDRHTVVLSDANMKRLVLGKNWKAKYGPNTENLKVTVTLNDEEYKKLMELALEKKDVLQQKQKYDTQIMQGLELLNSVNSQSDAFRVDDVATVNGNEYVKEFTKKEGQEHYSLDSADFGSMKFNPEEMYMRSLDKPFIDRANALIDEAKLARDSLPSGKELSRNKLLSADERAELTGYEQKIEQYRAQNSSESVARYEQLLQQKKDRLTPTSEQTAAIWEQVQQHFPISAINLDESGSLAARAKDYFATLYDEAVSDAAPNWKVNKLARQTAQQIANTNPKKILSGEEYARYTTLMNKLNANKSATRLVGRVWTPKDLQAMADPSKIGTVTAEHLATYKAYLDKHDYYGALNWLKNNKRELHVKSKKNGGVVSKSIGYIPYARVNDSLEFEDGNQEE